jgi:hypothetical protein
MEKGSRACWGVQAKSRRGFGVGSAEYGDLVAEDEQLDILGRRGASHQHQSVEEPAEDQVEEA